ncbi:MAG: N-acetylmuramoyl-L-alanine amidase [Hyphomicrobiaceae bacterium]
MNESRISAGWLAAVFAAVLQAAALVSVQSAVAQGKAPDNGRDSAGKGWGVRVAQAQTRARATSIRLSGDAARTHVVVDVTRPVAASVFVVANPYRAVVDVPDLDFVLPASAGRKGHGIVSAYRYGQFEAGRSRIVMDATAPVSIENAMFSPPAGGRPGRLQFDIVRLAGNEPRPTPPQAKPKSKARMRAGKFEDELNPKAGVAGKKHSSRPVVVIDPGHGGLDPGTISATNVTEKSVVLAVARQLRALLRRSGRYDVRMTRDHDVFVSLDARVAFSRKHGADLFISIHADALAGKEAAASVRGATIYTLSEKASDAAARALAEKENSSDLLAGIESVSADEEDHVRSILLDLVRRETANFSAQMRQILVKTMRSKVALSRDPKRAASFKVLRQTETPSVLIELGYMSNPQDFALLTRNDWQAKAARAIGAAVDEFFSSHQKKANR